MSEWRPLTQPPQTVGLVRYSDESRQIEFMAQWDGRQFRHASGLLIGMAIAPMKGDVWKTVEESHVLG
ncbi:hypothetical protein E5S69_31595 [Cupriavidus necator]|uniref:hypothetical protein n=1 Tax=Cupriavidus necator TaxID=106590 RepID=UPI00148F9B37|nr:hypothetical protein [Cupriavidus necator]NOV28032.1 hypothetical protein [Cupriavidus necator]